MENHSYPSSQFRENVALRSIHTHSFLQILKELKISLVVSTYQAGKVIVIRADDETVNTHFRQFPKPMGLAVSHDPNNPAISDRIAIGTESSIWDLRNHPAVAQKLSPPDKHDACFVPRQIHVTGDIDIHEMAWAGDDIWFLNTKFSCLCTLDSAYSFMPRWRPPFISAYDFRDRCHLNGLGLREGQPRYVTALGETDQPGEWRLNKAFGGILMDIEQNEIIIRNLSMPHSPRWYRDRLWILESGQGSLGYWDEQDTTMVTVAQLPGFTRGLAFYGNLAFVGLSQVRESAVFSGLPLTQTSSERNCGIWVLNIDTGEILAFLKFENAVQEIFSVAVLDGMVFPELLNWSPEHMGNAYVLPDDVVAETVVPPSDWQSPDIHFERGNQFYLQGQLKDAIAAYRECLELQPTFLPARYNLGVALGDLEDYPQAEAELKAVIAAEARHAEAYNSLGNLYRQQKRFRDAWAVYKQALEIYPNFPKALQNLGLLQLQQEESDS